MTGFLTLGHFSLVLLSLGLGVWCSGEASIDLAPMEKSEKEALYSAIQGFVGNWWNGSDLYPDPCGWTPIQGVSCDLFDGLWYVTSMAIGPVEDNFPDCITNVEFRPQFFELKHLKSISFFSCFMSPRGHPAAIPSQNWEKLAGSLESLEFRSNPGLTGQLPSTLGSLRNLQSLVLLENGLTGNLPPSLCNLIKLRRLVLAGNWLVGEIPDIFGGLSQLLILDLSRNRLSGNLPMNLGGLGSLLKLDLSNNQLEGKLPREIGYLKNLTLLDLRHNKFSGALIKPLEELQSLEEMVLSNNPIGGDLMGIEWQKLQNLVFLDLSSMALAGEVPESISKLKSLRYLGLRNNNLSGTLTPKLETLPCLSALYLNGNNLSGELKFSKLFYSKMGRRFGASGNPNLCYIMESVHVSHAPHGVKQCVEEEVTVLEPNSVTKLDYQSSHSLASSGWSGHGIDGFWLVEILAMLALFVLNHSL